MIKDLPTPQEFEKLGLDCIYKSFEMLYKVSNAYSEASEDEIIKDDVPEKDYWNYNDITVRTSLIVLFQGVEYLMKKEVTEKSPLLLLENNKSDWPTLPDRKDKNFDELITISGENLLGVFCAVESENFDLESYVKKFEDLRIRRNKLVHSTGFNDLNYKSIVKDIIFFTSAFYHNTYWLDFFRSRFKSEPMFGYWDWDIEEAYFFTLLNFIKKSLSKKELNDYLPIDYRGRKFLCPNCTYWLTKNDDVESVPKWSFLNPNSPEAEKIECMICNGQYDIERADCENEECRGNVISKEEGYCLTCFSQQ
ncbi:hypothetical protein [Gramella sp. AN32]|uniref:Uncharacterized protein n=1 Tax=Christiangramia antarctica TaxID=2058158 RepID=A0ABW5XAU6_9FLAO|nr:hypothetical protein [Gramella sp. AN32]MCM4157271.1 hypothetical protein [Gramella sp. AN32]